MQISTEFLSKYNIAGPRYTSYPPATSFKNDFSKETFFYQIINSNNSNIDNISIYIHIPFCRQRCYFCGCNTSKYKSEDIIATYINAVCKEIESVAINISKSKKVSQIHFGGGTPNAINFSHLDKIIKTIKDKLVLYNDCEIAIECNPAYLDKTSVENLAQIGFNRISIGVQDFNEEILKAVNRLSSKLPLKELFTIIRANGFYSINLDLIYGLPLQDINKFQYSVNKAIELQPDRIVTFSYAHVPWVNSLQKKLEHLEFPTPYEKLNMLTNAINTFSANGYLPIGMDHFAKLNDELAIAKLNRNLHRNFQGYCTKKRTGQVYAFGASAISQLEFSYMQNVKNVDEYISRINHENCAVEKGYLISENEIIVREVINEIMCNGQVYFNNIAHKFGISVDKLKSITSYNSFKLNDFVKDELIEVFDDKIIVNNKGMMVVRNIAMAFDPALEGSLGKFSKTV